MTSCRPIVNRFVAAILSLTPAILDARAADADPTAESTSKERVAQFIVKVKASATPQSTHPNGPEDEAHAALARRAVERVLQETEVPSVGRARRSAERIVETRPMSGAAHVVTLSTPVRGEMANEIAARLQAQPEIEYAEPDYRLYRQLRPSDPLYEKQWGFGGATGAARFEAAWDTTTGSSEAVIAVVDTGYRPHPDLVAHLLPGYDFLTDPVTANDGDGRDADASDPGDWVTVDESLACDGTDRLAGNSSWHGTHVAGTIGAVANNEIGGAGGVWQARILPVRALGKCGGPASDIIDAIRWAVGLPVPGIPVNAHPAKVVNMSLGTSQPCGRAMQSAIDDVLAQGATLVAAAGNGGTEVGEPASCLGAIAVAAIDANGKLPAFSNSGERIDIGAPGVDILSTSNAGLTVPGDDTYRSLNGTSMAAPHVSAAAALMLAVEPGLTPEAIRDKLRASARLYPAESNCMAKHDAALCGAGMLDVAAAVAAAHTADAPTAPH
ncbi:S8 family peptidase [Trinickia sp. NRRL B-1857]|uniref:S8 family peptidase n=1 Tax=Trinickia sp. NRRL B-1857 TaxID=3162879 RepID=UPI003D2AAD56